MQYKDFNNFTWEELSYLQYKDLMLGKLELLKQVNQSAEVPPEVVNKIRFLYSELAKSISDPSLRPPADKEALTLAIVFEYLGYLITIKETTEISISIFNFIKPHLYELISFLIAYFNIQ